MMDRTLTHVAYIYNKAFSIESSLKNHIDSVHKELKYYKCDLCDKGSSKASDLKTHVKSVHEKLKKSQM